MIKTVLLSLFLAFSANSGIILAQSSVDEDNGILGFRLGYPPDSMDGIQRDGKSQRLIRWIPEADQVEVDGIPIKSVKLYFWEGKLHSVEVKTATTDSDLFKVWLENRYGPGEKEDAMGFRFSWAGEKSRVLFEQNIITHDAMTTFLCEKVHESYYRYMHHLKYGN
jgi:hypothetical protein